MREFILSISSVFGIDIKCLISVEIIICVIDVENVV